VSVERVGLVLHAGRSGARDAAATLIEWFRDHDVKVRTLTGETVGTEECLPPAEFCSDLDLVVSVGGDGTLLRAAQMANEADVPLLGVKVGRVGFLTEVEPAEAPELLLQVLEGKVRIEKRLALVAQVVGDAGAPPQWGLNEVIVEKHARHRLVRIATTIGGQYVTTFSADGVIVATPTGSTAYSFSARGPIVSPDLSCILVTPVSPHMVFDRSIVLPPDEEIMLEVLPEESSWLSADGRRGIPLAVGARVRIQRAERPARLVRREGSPSFFALLQEKFSLPWEAPHGSHGSKGSSGPGSVRPPG
jgi:NAD+ kinase